MFKFSFSAQHVPTTAVPRLCAAQALCLTAGLEPTRYFNTVNKFLDHSQLWFYKHAGSDGVLTDFNVFVQGDGGVEYSRVFSISIPAGALVQEFFDGSVECTVNGVTPDEQDPALRQAFLNPFITRVKFRRSIPWKDERGDDWPYKIHEEDDEYRFGSDLRHPIIR